MTDEQVQQVIDASLNTTFLDNWQLYAIMFSVSLLGAWLGAFTKSFGTEKAKYSAIKTSLDTIRKQVETTTRTSESIKTALDHDNWRKKELEVNKRNQIEEYFAIILSIPDSLNNEMQSELFNKKTSFSQDIFYKAGLIQALYLPEISSEHVNFFTKVNEFKEWIYIGMEMKNTNYKNGGPDRADSFHLDLYQEHVLALQQPKLDLLDKLKCIASEINQ